MKVVGLTGGIASGKSTVSKTIQSLNIPLIDCDLLARLVVEPTHPCYHKLVKHFGTVILQDQEMGKPLDRYKFGTIIFSDPVQRRVANGIIHPAVRDEILKRLFKLWIKGTSLVVIDVPLLLEGELWRIVSDVIVVYCPPEVQLERIKSRDGLSEEDALARINAQRPLIEKVDYADHVIYNTSDLESLKAATLKVMDTIKPNPFWTVLAYFPPFTILLAGWVIGKRHFKGDPRKILDSKSKKDDDSKTAAQPASSASS
ncbi:MAG: CoaE-domain-containing protein [Linnemannia gamsii]|nr:MAG: CoaE-domain-containing protein [Linnemannia gamsii]